MKLTKFQDMDQGQWFREDSGSRVMLKIQSQLPSGLRQFSMRVCLPAGDPAVDPSLGNASTVDEVQGCKKLAEGLPFNAIDSVGVQCFCSPWLEFEPIENPFPKQ